MWKMRYYARRYETPVSLGLIVAMAVLYIFDFFGGGRLTLLLAWSPSVAWLKTGWYWQPLTFPLVHGNNIWGLLFDGILLYWFGGSLERAWGSAKFLIFFFTSGIIAGIALMPQTLAFPGAPFFIGMAGSFVAITVAFAAMNPYAPIMFWFVPMQARWMALIIVAFDLFGNSGRYGGPLQAVMAVGISSLYGYVFATRRVALPSLRGGGTHGPSMKERFERWQQRRRMRQWQRRVSKIERPEDLFKDR